MAGRFTIQSQPITLIPVGLKEAALDSPTFRSGFIHFVEQLDLVERWLESYIKCIAKLSHELGAFESLINGFLGQTIPPSHISEAVIDHDYTLLAMKRYGETATEFWTATISGLKKMESNMMEPIRMFLQNDLRAFKETRRNLDQSQKQLDSLQSRYSAQAKSKETSSLREDAFQLHEARKAYLKSSMDFSFVAPQLRMALDKMLVKVFSDQWRDMFNTRQKNNPSMERWGSDIERVKGWSREMENGEKAFRRELQDARKQIEETAEATTRPSRELDDYSTGLGSVSGSRGPSSTNLQTPGGKSRHGRPEKQGWLNLRTVSGKPSRTVWLRRWFYVKNGIFGWLVQGSRSGGVEESERIGVLLCNVKPANSDDRRYVFEVKTKDTTIVLQAETLPELDEWLAAFEVAKQKALEDPASTESPGLEPQAQDPAFAISPPIAPEFAASAADSGMPQHTDETLGTLGVDRSSTLPIPGGDLTPNRSSFDVTGHRRSFADKDSDGIRDPASRIIQKLDLHRKPLSSTQAPSSPGISGGGIASLIAASHSSMPVGPGALPPPQPPETQSVRKSSAPIPTMRRVPSSTLAPNTLINPPAPTNLSSVAVIVNGERGIGLGRTDASGGMPSGIMANIWGSSNWGHLNRLERGELKASSDRTVQLSNPPSPFIRPSNGSTQTGLSPKSAANVASNESALPLASSDKAPAAFPASSSLHRKTISLDGDDKRLVAPPDYPNYYPLQLKTQDAQFRLLFPSVRREEKVVLVFKATWNPNEQQEFPGRVYVTAKEMYFYSNHCGMTLISSIALDAISEVTAATGKQCDFLFCHLKETDNQTKYTRITIKTFLEPLRLLQRRLSFLVRNCSSEGSSVEEIMKTLIKLEQNESGSSPSGDSWEHVSINTPTDGDSTPNRRASRRSQRDLRANVRIDPGLYGERSWLDGAGENGKAFKLPKQPVIYTPSGMARLVIEKEFDVSPKALFHVMFGDKSAVWQLLYHERRAQHIRQGPWVQPTQGYLRRNFEYQMEYLDILRRAHQAQVEDHQMVEVGNEHLLYVVSDRKMPWHLPYRDRFLLLTKIVITHLAKSRCKLAVYTQVEWTKMPPIVSGIVAKAALKDLDLDAFDLTDVIADQVRNFASAHGRTKKAIQIFGHIGIQNHVSEFAGSEAPLKAQLRRSVRPRTLMALTFESLLSIFESVVTSALQVFVKLLRWAWTTLNANTVVIALLAFSIAANVISSSTTTSAWWQERKAGNFMKRLGVGPDAKMSKAILVQDLEEATALEVGFIEPTQSQCRDTFSDIMNLEDTGAPYSLRESPSWQTNAAHRLQNTRQHLSSQRHDLLVAIRVVNGIERNVMQAEWENWLLAENINCQLLGARIHQNDTHTLAERKGNGQQPLRVEPSRLETIRAWHQDYCESCYEEQDLLRG